MLRITIEMLPGGDPKRARVLGVGEIANVGGTETSGDYAVRLLRAGKRRATWQIGRVLGFPRKTLGAWDLLLRALADVLNGLGSRRAVEVPASWQASISEAALEDVEARAMNDRSEEIGDAIRAWLAVDPTYRAALLASLRARDESGAARAAADMLEAWTAS